MALRRFPDPKHTDFYRLYKFLNHLKLVKPHLEIYILCWNYSWVFTHERELWPWLRPGSWGPGINFRYDKIHPAMGCQHEKIVVIDDQLAFVGGIDICEGRWDDSRHDPGNLLRRDRKGNHYRPFHDLQWMVEGKIVETISQHAMKRWKIATLQDMKPVQTKKSHWPATIEPDFVDTEIEMALTEPKFNKVKARRDQYRLTLQWIRTARKFIYIENQYLTSKVIIRALGQRLKEADGPDVVCVIPKKPFSWFDSKTMGVSQFRAIKSLRKRDIHGRLRVCYPRIYPGEIQSVYIHAKLLLVDDIFLKIGSTNLNNRSLSLDRECDLYVHATNESIQTQIRKVRYRLFAEHFGIEPSEVEELEKTYTRLHDLIDHRRSYQRSLRQWERSASRFYLDALPAEPFFDPYRSPTSFSVIRWFVNIIVFGFIKTRITVRSRIQRKKQLKEKT